MDPLPGALTIWVGVVGFGWLLKKQGALNPLLWALISVVDIICTVVLFGAIAWHWH